MAQAPPDTARLAEYTALREEIQNRSDRQETLLGLNVTAVGAIVGVVLAKHASPAALLVLPPVVIALGFIWTDHHSVIGELDSYIRNKCYVWEPRWELPSSIRGLGFWIPMGLVWIAPSAGALVALKWELSAKYLSGLHAFWLADVVIVGLFAISFICVVAFTKRRP